MGNSFSRKLAARLREPGTPHRVRLIEVGWCDTIRADELKVGDKRLYNYGGIAEVVSIERASARWLAIVFKDDKGKIWPPTRLMDSSLVVPFPTKVYGYEF